ncbi:MAG: hypothetical protein OQJ95_06540 [Kangiella sp.]|nr:hypothetical protein [Kangiella sp.]MCW9029239.1 hypothetical protein [Kangiella sp.]
MKNLLMGTLLLTLMAGCASMNDALTPDTQVRVDDFDGSKEIIQKPVSAASSMSEGWNTLGFRWNSKAPDIVFMNAGAEGITNVTGLEFNVDGDFVIAQEASHLTKYGQWSTRQFAVSLDDFMKIAKGKVVKMKVVMIDEYAVSSFGTEVNGAVVNSKFPKFLEQLKKITVASNKTQ